MAKTSNLFELLLFATDPEAVRIASHAGIHGFIVDLENRGKSSRQSGFDTQINSNSIKDLETVRHSTDRNVICRINGYGESTPLEVEQVIQVGVDEIFLPMVRQTQEVIRTLDLIRGRCSLGILVETMDAVQNAQNLAELPLSRIYVGLNDLAIDRKRKNIFLSVVDGTLDTIRDYFEQPFGFGGVTLPEFGEPIPCQLLMGELIRLKSNFTFLRRSFYRDIAGRDMQVEVPRILKTLEEKAMRTSQQVEFDRLAFNDNVLAWGDQGAKN